MWVTWICYLLHMPQLVLGIEPACTWPGIKPSSLQPLGKHSNTVQGPTLCFKKPSYIRGRGLVEGNMFIFSPRETSIFDSLLTWRSLQETFTRQQLWGLTCFMNDTMLISQMRIHFGRYPSHHMEGHSRMRRRSTSYKFYAGGNRIGQ